MEQQNCGGQAAVWEESCQAKGEVRQGNNSPSKSWKNDPFFCSPKKLKIVCCPQDIVAYRTKGKVDSESAATADDDEEEEDEEEGEEEEDDDEEDDE